MSAKPHSKSAEIRWGEKIKKEKAKTEIKKVEKVFFITKVVRGRGGRGR